MTTYGKNFTNQISQPSRGSMAEQLLAVGFRVPEKESDNGMSSAKPGQTRSALKATRQQKSCYKTSKKQGKKNKSHKEKGRNIKMMNIIERSEAGRVNAVVAPTASIYGEDLTVQTTNPVQPQYYAADVQRRMKELAKGFQKRQLQPSADIEKLTNKITSADRFEMENRRSAFDELRPYITFDDDAETELVIGFDFGSTSSKVVCRFPYDEGLGAYAVPNTDGFSAERHPYYWQAKLWEQNDGTFDLVPSLNSKLHDHLKLTLFNSDNSNSEAMLHVTAYLTLMIRQSLGWLWQKVGSAIDREKKIRLSANFGFPTITGGDSEEKKYFELCAKAALSLAASNGSVSQKNLNDELKKAESGVLQMLGNIMVVPEFIGAVMGYFHSAQKKNGQFMICDIGGLTIDAVCFGFHQENGRNLIKIYGSAVETYGAEIAKTAIKDGVSPEGLAKAIAKFVCDPLRDAYEINWRLRCWDGEMPLFIIGGGRHYEGYQNSFTIAEKFIENGLFKTKFLETALSLNEELDSSEAKDQSCKRLLVAWGLSHSDLDLPEILTRAEIQRASPQTRRDTGQNFVGQEQT